MNNESCLVLISQNNTLIKTAENALARPFHGSYSAFNHFLKTLVMLSEIMFLYRTYCAMNLATILAASF